jgi:hypothetical protein
MPPRAGTADGRLFNFVNDLTNRAAAISGLADCLLSTQAASRLCNAQIRHKVSLFNQNVDA